MEALHRDLIGNLVMFISLWISARKTPRRRLFWQRLLLGAAVFSILRYVYFTHITPLLTVNLRQLPQMAGFTCFIPLLALVAMSSWEMDFWGALCCSSSAYCIQHIVNKSYSLVRASFLSEAAFEHYLAYLGLCAAALLVYWLAVRTQRAYRVRVDNKLLLILSVLCAIVSFVVGIIFLVIQIGGSGGTFPIDVTPQFFQTLNPYMPFTFVINAMRECVCGTYANDYWLDLLKLCIYIGVGLIIGLGVKFLVKKPIRFFEKKVEKTGLF